jgi:hypothetical protein
MNDHCPDSEARKLANLPLSTRIRMWVLRRIATHGQRLVVEIRPDRLDLAIEYAPGHKATVYEWAEPLHLMDEKDQKAIRAVQTRAFKADEEARRQASNAAYANGELTHHV